MRLGQLWPFLETRCGGQLGFEKIVVSVIIPTYRRDRILKRVLDGLASQTFPPDRFEVVVVLDGSHPPTESMLGESRCPFRLKWFVRPHHGETWARNFGLTQAVGDYLLFLDDDVLPDSHLIEKHMEAHQRSDRLVVLGALQVHPDSPEKFLAETTDFTGAVFRRCSAEGYEPTYLDFLDGNFSTRKQYLAELHGWDESLEEYGGIDDFDLGYRLSKLGLTFRFEPQALGFHYYVKSLGHFLRDIRITGRAQVYFFQKHPECVRDLRFPSIINGAREKVLVFGLSRIVPEFIFSGIIRSTNSLSLGRKFLGGGLCRLFVRSLAGLFLCRGFWEGPVNIRALQRQLAFRIPLLSYELVSRQADSDNPLWTQALARQFDWLKESGCRTISLSELHNWLARLEPLPIRPIALVFHGTDLRRFNAVVQELQKRNFKATLFPHLASAGKHDGDNPEWCGFMARIYEFGGELLEVGMCAAGPLSSEGLAGPSFEDEVRATKLWMRENGGLEPHHFFCHSKSFAPGLFGVASRNGLLTACTEEPGVNDFASESFGLKTIAVNPEFLNENLGDILSGQIGRNQALGKFHRFWRGRTDPDWGLETKEDFDLLLAELRSLIGTEKRRNVLEIGCGNGILFSPLGFDKGAYRGVDFSESMLKAFHARHPNVELICTEASSYLDPGTKFDLIFSHQVVQHMDQQMLDRHLGNAKAMMHDDSLLVCASIPWKLHESNFYSGLYTGNRKSSLFTLAINRVRRLLGRDRMGYWYSGQDLHALGRRHGLSVTIHGSMNFLYRFHVVMKLAAGHGVSRDMV